MNISVFLIVIGLRFAADSMGQRLLHSSQRSLKVEPSESKTADINRVLHEIATQGHSTSFVLQSVACCQWITYRHIIMLSLSPKFPKLRPLN